MEYVPARQLLTPTAKDDITFFYQDYNLNLYRGCSHGCIYCDSRSVCYQLKRFDTVRAKENALELLRSELRTKKSPGIVSMGSMSDPYNPFEQQMKLTQGALQLLKEFRFGVGYATKSDLAARDASLLKEISYHNGVRATFSITCAKDALCAKLEPNAPLTSKRFQAMAAISKEGLFTGTWLNPMVPFLTDDDDNLLDLLRMTKEAGGQYVVCFFGMSLRTGSREYFFQAIDRTFPGLRHQYTETFGNDYIITSPRADHLYAIFKAECKRLGLLYRFTDINQAMMANKSEQLSFF